MNEEEIITEAFTQLENHAGLRWKWKTTEKDVDGIVDLYIKNNEEHFFIEVKNELRNYQLAKLLELNKRFQPFMVVANRIFPTLKEKLREQQINYLDGAGNVYINTTKNTIWLEGFKYIEVDKLVTNRAFTKTGLKMVFYLLLHSDAINMPQRAIAEATGIALGNIKNVINGLNDAGFILKLNAKKMQLQNRKALLDRWIAGYGETLKPAIHIGNFRLPTNRTFSQRDDFPVYPGQTLWGGEAAAEILTGYLNPEILTVYTTERKSEMMINWKLIPDAKGNIHLFEKFWKDEKTDQRDYVPELLVCADLLLTGDPRCLETAEMIYNKYLKNEFEQH